MLLELIWHLLSIIYIGRKIMLRDGIFMLKNFL